MAKFQIESIHNLLTQTRARISYLLFSCFYSTSRQCRHIQNWIRGICCFECCLRVRLNPVSVFIALDKYMHTYDTFIVWRFHFWKSKTISIFQSWKRKSHTDSILIVWKSFHFVLFKSGRFGRKVKDPSCSLYKCILIRQILLWVYTGASKFGWRCIRTTPIA